MKLSAALTTLSLSASITAVQSHLRALVQKEGIHERIPGLSESSCISITEEDRCNNSTDDENESCVWCKCSAVPSECVSLGQSRKLPAGVFDCASSPNATDVDSDMIARPSVVSTVRHDNDADSRYDGKLMNYVLTSGEVDGDLCDPGSKSYSGYVDISGSEFDTHQNKHLFYWFFEKRSDSTSAENVEVKESDAEIPLILWLTGGPGCSSTLALLSENGPCSVATDASSTEINQYSWTKVAHVLWLDQPAGVGFSYGDENDYNEEMISEDAYYFLQSFFKEHPKYKSSPLYVVGESYGGHYAPAIAHKVWSKNKENDDSFLHINLGGLAVGNGLTDPEEQYKWYPEMAFNNSHGIKAVSETVYETMKSTVPKCVKLIEECNAGNSFINKFACQTAFVMCNTGLTTPYQMTIPKLNPYDIRKECGSHPLCYDFSHIKTWLNSDSTKAALNVKNDAKWNTCNMGINMKFHTDWMKDFSPFVADLINAGIPALIYAGDVDFICNYLGNQAWTNKLEWDHKEDFSKAEVKEWGRREDGSVAGSVKTSNGFTFMQVFDAGHMVPSDQPYVALDMIKTFVEGGTF